jgi:Ca2+-binding RTX toxin-like protein
MLGKFPSTTTTTLMKIITILIGLILVLAGFSLPSVIVFADDGSHGVSILSFVSSLSLAIDNHKEEFNDDFDHNQEVGDDVERTVITTGSEAETLSTLPTHPEDNTITGNNDGDPIRGTNNDDTIIGTFLNDRIFGRDGDDTLNGAYGSDTIEGNDGEDTVQGAELDDQIYGDKGNDVLSGGDGNDYISAGDGTDELYSGFGDDTLRGGDGADYFDCGFGFDVVLDYDKSEGDVFTMDCEVVNEVNK